MPADLRSILGLEVPIIVLLGERLLRTSEVVALVPGAIIELPKNSEDELTLLVNNKPVGAGQAVKVGENFGLRLTFIGDLKARINALGAGPAHAAAAGRTLPAASEDSDAAGPISASGAKAPAQPAAGLAAAA